MPQFKDSSARGRESQKEYEAIAEAERLKKARRDNLKGKYSELLKDYHCEKMFVDTNLPFQGLANLKLMARKEEEFSEKPENYMSIACLLGKNLISRLKVWIPDTIVYHDLESSYWLYSNEACVVWRTDNFNFKTVSSKLSNFCSDNELVAILKSDAASTNVRSKLLTANDLSMISQQVGTQGSDKSRCIIQRYIKSIGSKAFKVRTVWSKDSPPYCFIVTNKSGYYDYDGVQDIYKYMVVPETRNPSCTIFKTNKGKQLTDTLPYVENVAKFFRGAYGAEVNKIAADFIKDESGIWWMVNIKAIQLKYQIPDGVYKRVFNGEEEEDIVVDPRSEKIHKRPEGYQKIKLCRYCETPFHSEELTKKMTLKMAIELDRHLKYRGYKFDWLDRSERQFLDTSNLYEAHQVCKVWYGINKTAISSTK